MSKIMGPPGAVSTSGAPQGAPAPDRPASELPSAAFTPGPWTAHQGWADPWIDLDARLYPDWCEVTGPEGPPHFSISGHFGIANARLIAAAPDMYADGVFLLARLDDFESVLTADPEAREFCGHVAPAIARFRAALAKATRS